MSLDERKLILYSYICFTSLLILSTCASAKRCKTGKFVCPADRQDEFPLSFPDPNNCKFYHTCHTLKNSKRHSCGPAAHFNGESCVKSRCPTAVPGCKPLKQRRTKIHGRSFAKSKPEQETKTNLRWPYPDPEKSTTKKPKPTTTTKRPTPTWTTKRPTPTWTTKRPTPTWTTKRPTPTWTTKRPTPTWTTKRPTPTWTTKKPKPTTTTTTKPTTTKPTTTTTAKPTTTSPDEPCFVNRFVCEKKGWFPDPADCQRYFQCINVGTGFKKIDFNCGPGWHYNHLYCHPEPCPRICEYID